MWVNDLQICIQHLGKIKLSFFGILYSFDVPGGPEVRTPQLVTFLLYCYILLLKLNGEFKTSNLLCSMQIFWTNVCRTSNVSHSSVRFGTLSENTICYFRDTVVDTVPLDNYFLFQIYISHIFSESFWRLMSRNESAIAGWD